MYHSHIGFIYCAISSLMYHSLGQIVCVYVSFMLLVRVMLFIIICLECGFMGIGDRVIVGECIHLLCNIVKNVCTVSSY